MLAYKIVSVHNNRLFSYVCFGEDEATYNKTVVEYKVGEKVYPKVLSSKLFVLKELNDCHVYLSDAREERIYLCEIPDDGTTHPYEEYGRFVIDVNWEIGPNNIKLCPIWQMSAFPGLLLTDWVKLIREVNINEEAKLD